MNVIAFILAIVAAVIFLFVGDAVAFGGRTRTSVSLGLFFLTVALIVQFIAKSHTVTF